MQTAKQILGKKFTDIISDSGFYIFEFYGNKNQKCLFSLRDDNVDTFTDQTIEFDGTQEGFLQEIDNLLQSMYEIPDYAKIHPKRLLNYGQHFFNLCDLKDKLTTEAVKGMERA